MTIDERLQALTESVELLAVMHRDNERALTARFAELADAMKRLARIADIHQDRLDDHEQRLDDLEAP